MSRNANAKSFKDRPAGSRLLAAALAGEFDRLIFLSLDRFGRSPLKGLTDYDALEAAGVGLVFVKDMIDTSTPQGRMLRNLLLVLAEWERELIQERTSVGKLAKSGAATLTAG